MQSSGAVFVRAGACGQFQPAPLATEASATEGRCRPRPGGDRRLASADSRTTPCSEQARRRRRLTLPAGGAAAPHRSLPLGRAVQVVASARHEFGACAKPDTARRAGAMGQRRRRGGPGRRDATSLRSAAPRSTSTRDGAVSVLDEAHRRVLRWTPGALRPGRASLSRSTARSQTCPSVTDGTMYVLESVAEPGRATARSSVRRSGTRARGRRDAERRRRSFGSAPMGLSCCSSRRASGCRVAASGDAARRPRRAEWQVAPAGRSAGGRGDRPPAEAARSASLVVDGDACERRGGCTSETPLAEVQLAEPLGTRLVVVVARLHRRVRTSSSALVLGPGGLVRTRALDSADWAEAAPLSRFRLLGYSLYQLGSTPDGALRRSLRPGGDADVRLALRFVASPRRDVRLRRRRAPRARTTRDSSRTTATTPRRHRSSYITRDGSAAVALRARFEGYQWAGGCWNDNDRDDSPGDPSEDPALEARAATARGSRSRSGANRRARRTRLLPVGHVPQRPRSVHRRQLQSGSGHRTSPCQVGR